MEDPKCYVNVMSVLLLIIAVILSLVVLFSREKISAQESVIFIRQDTAANKEGKSGHLPLQPRAGLYFTALVNTFNMTNSSSRYVMTY